MRLYQGHPHSEQATVDRRKYCKSCIFQGVLAKRLKKKKKHQRLQHCNYNRNQTNLVHNGPKDLERPISKDE